MFDRIRTDLAVLLVMIATVLAYPRAFAMLIGDLLGLP